MVKEFDRKRGSLSRSDFLRDIVCDYLIKHGVQVPDKWRRAPDRAGKGGRIPRPKSNSALHRAVAALPAAMMNDLPAPQPSTPIERPTSYKRQPTASNRRRKGSPPPDPTQGSK
jgi:hypothetical protein